MKLEQEREDKQRTEKEKADQAATLKQTPKMKVCIPFPSCVQARS